MADTAYITRLQNSIRSNIQYINRCNNYINNLNSQKHKNEQRIRELQTIRNSVVSGFIGTTDDVVDKQNDFIRKLESAVQKHGHTHEIAQSVNGDKEPSLPSDSNGNGIILSIDREITRCQQEIEDADRNISQYKREIDEARAANNRMSNAIAEERQKQ